MQILRNVTRHKLRSFLTISGIVIGVLALTTMGALAENFNALIDGGVTYFGGSISVGPPDGASASLLPLSKIDEIKKVPGVEAAFPSYSFSAKPGSVSTVSFGIPDTIIAGDPAETSWSALKISYAQGHGLTSNSRGLDPQQTGQIGALCGDFLAGNVTDGSPTSTISTNCGGQTGPIGPAGQTGPTGPAGTTGATGPAGARGAAGKVELVTCKTIIRTVNHKHKKKLSCTTKFVTGPLKFTAARVHASLSRRGIVYAIGYARLKGTPVGTRLEATRPLARGRYLLVLSSGGRVLARRVVTID